MTLLDTLLILKYYKFDSSRRTDGCVYATPLTFYRIFFWQDFDSLVL